MIPAYVTAGIIFLFTVIFDRSSLRNVDFMLLLTFICFFIFTGNIAEIEPVRVFLQEKISGADFPAAVIAAELLRYLHRCRSLESGFPSDSMPLTGSHRRKSLWNFGRSCSKMDI